MSDIDNLLAELETLAKRSRPKRAPLPDRFERTEPFNPDSHLQIQELAAHFGVKLPRRKDSDDEDSLSTEKKYLLKAAKRYPVFAKVLECKQLWKMVSTYNWKLDSTNHVHTTLGWHPSTWRKSSRDYNLQNIPKRSALATEFRRMVIAPPGHVILEADSSAIEAVLVGYFARSERFIRLAKCGVHDWFNSLVHGEPIPLDLSEVDLRAACKGAKVRYDKPSREVAKRVVHLSNYRGTPEKMQEEYPEEFATVKDARVLQKLYLDSEPGQDIQRWWKQTLDRASHDRFLLNPFGFRHRFFHIYGYDRTNQSYKLGDDAKRAIAFLPQSTASALQDVYIEGLWSLPMASWLALPVHDSLLAYVPVAEALEAAAATQRVFTQPIPELGGLTIGAELSMSGPQGNWGPRTPENPDGMETIHVE